MKQNNISVFQQDPAARFTLGLLGALQATVAGTKYWKDKELN